MYFFNLLHDFLIDFHLEILQQSTFEKKIFRVTFYVRLKTLKKGL